MVRSASHAAVAEPVAHSAAGAVVAVFAPHWHEFPFGDSIRLPIPVRVSLLLDLLSLHSYTVHAAGDSDREF